MTLTAAQEEIVRVFLNGMSLFELDSRYVDAADAALRAALIEKDAEIERLEERIAQLGDGWGLPRG